MRTIQTSLLVGVAAIACIGVAAVAASPQPNTQTHVLTVRLPDGSVEQIRYRGDVAPQVILSPGGMPSALFGPSAAFGPGSTGSPFAMLDRLSAQMDREMADMMRNAPIISPPSLAVQGGLRQTNLGKLPAGADSYSFVSVMHGGKACTRSVEITSQGPNEKPRVVSQTSGDCAGQNGAVAAPSATGHDKVTGKVTA